MNIKTDYAKLSAISILLICLSGCISPDLKEPKVLLCNIMIDELECYDNEEPEIITKIIPMIDALGWYCMSPSDRADAENHHDALHIEINRKKKK